ncbi:Copper resistance protein B [Thiomonas arsenitoxydans]|jgi:copper resistance protein B|uniref:Copper resistance protein B n=1 Tax=Thiomonas arsenitoxydans (strain DSM 22701 / CIP 110005 / 3As) TaxID=426114 RepID=A0ABP1Z8B9_THIA3|nr:copper resistance protein B [Thiomonas arsenitoxydans]OZB55614.1 MAG: copper resistance protein CopB [Thiomonas sp. 15-63-373]CQR38282.1 Copper resistance protein B [Thiomonas arsenitoxydans]CQR39227.1 Copper resistance protein B [Thiomonas arsenitoxydans]
MHTIIRTSMLAAAIAAAIPASAQAMDMHGMDMQGMDMPTAPATAAPARPAAAPGGSMAGMNMPGMSMPQQATAPAAGRVAHSADSDSGGYTLSSGPYIPAGVKPPRMADQESFGSVLVDRLERAHSHDSGNWTTYDVQAWYGRDFNRAVLKAEGQASQGRLQDARTELLWGHAIAPYWDSQLGVRHDNGGGPDRNWLAFGVQGLAPYWFNVEATGYLGDQGRSALRLSASYELLLTQRVVLQPQLELNAYGKDDPARGIGSGLSDATAGLRLRYDISRQFSPYIGVEWSGRFGRTGDYAQAAGERRDTTDVVAGVHFWF